MGDISADFEGETVIVTGGSSGIGRAVALAFGDAGATVLVADVQEDPKDVDADTPTHEAIERAGGDAAFVETDVSEPEEIESVVEAARAFGGVDVMVNNAGVHISKEFLDVTLEEFETVNQVNAHGAFFGTQAAARDMIDRGEPGSIINTASTTSTDAEWEHSHYAASKGSVLMTTRSAALELASEGIRVNAVAPGPIGTEITEGWTGRADEMRVEGDQPVPPLRAGTPEEVAPAYLYLASESASYVTGDLHRVDGGAGVS